MDAQDDHSSSQQVPRLYSTDQTDSAPSSSASTSNTVNGNRSAARRRAKLIQYIKYLHQQDRFWDRALRNSQDAWAQLSEASRRTNVNTSTNGPSNELASVLRPRSQENQDNQVLTEQHYLQRLDEGYNFLMFYLDKCEESVNQIIVNAENRLETCD